MSAAACLDDSPYVKEQGDSNAATVHDGSHTASAHSMSKQKLQGTEHHRSAQWLSVFNIRMQEGAKPRYEADALLAAAEDLAKKMRPFVTMPDMKCTNACVPDSRDQSVCGYYRGICYKGDVNIARSPSLAGEPPPTLSENPRRR